MSVCVCVYIHTQIDIDIQWDITSAIKKNAFESVLARWMNIQPVIHSGVSHKERSKYHILTRILGRTDGKAETLILWPYHAKS